MTSPATAIFLTYSHRPHFDEKDYEGFLRREDNPFFNSIPGIHRYENWKLARPYPDTLGFDYFDMIYLDGSRDVEAVWFDEELTKFRRHWVSLWGYSSFPPPVVNGQGYLMEGPEVPALSSPAEGKFAIAAAGAVPGALSWAITGIMPKHYAFPLGEAPSPWLRPMPQALPFDHGHILLATGPIATGSADWISVSRIAP